MSDRLSHFWQSEVEPRLSRDHSPATEGIAWVKLGPDGGRATCPLHADSDNKTAFVLFLTDGKWRWKCRTKCDTGGDLAELYRLMRGCGFKDAVRDLAAAVGLNPPAWLGPVDASFRPAIRPMPIAPRPAAPKVQPLTWEEQSLAVGRFLRLVFEADSRECESEADRYIVGARGLTSAAVLALGGAFAINRTPETSQALRKAIQDEPEEARALLARAGLLNRSEDGPLWHSRAVLLPCARPRFTGQEDDDGFGERFFYLTARVLDPGEGPKYLSQKTMGGAVHRVPYGLPALRAAADNRELLLIVEGPMDAIGARCFGLHAVSVHGRQGQGGAEMVAPWSKLLRKCREVLVLPDADSDPAKREVGAEAAGAMVAELIGHKIRARVTSLKGMGLAGDGIKDLADAARLRGRSDG